MPATNSGKAGWGVSVYGRELMAITAKTVENYDREQIKTALRAALAEFGGLEQLLAGKQEILLKPNFLVPADRRKGITTHPEVYLAVAELLLELGKNVTIGDSPAFASAQMCVRFHGARRECRRKGIRIITFRKVRQIAGAPNGKRFRKLSIAAELAGFDALINIPKLKVHQQCVFSGATKNLYGCVPGKRKAFRHFLSGNDPQLFARMILANASAANPALNIGDGILALHKRGPRTGGELYPLSRLLVSDSYLELDWLFCRLIGLDPEATPLFQVIPIELKAGLEDACRHLLESTDFTVAENFQLSPATPIRFSAWHMLKSIWKSFKASS